MGTHRVSSSPPPPVVPNPSPTQPRFGALLCVDQDDIFGVVPFLLAKEGVAPKSGLTFTAKDPLTVVFSIDTTVLKVCRVDGQDKSVRGSWRLSRRVLAAAAGGGGGGWWFMVVVLPLFLAADLLWQPPSSSVF